VSRLEENKAFKEGTVVGVLVDQERGTISYYKDGVDLGIAILSKEICDAQLFPFV